MTYGKAGMKTRARPSLWFVLMIPLVMAGCGHAEDPPREFPALPATLKSRYCLPAKAANPFPERRFLGQRFASTLSFAELRDAVNSSCRDCHQAPAQAGGVSYIDSHSAEERTIGGSTRVFPGLSEMAESFAHAIKTPDEPTRKQMPPEGRRKNNPEGYLRVGRMIEAWMAAGKPNGPFTMQEGDAKQPDSGAPYVPSSDIGDCVPVPEAVGWDYRRDRAFEEMKELPKSLIETDLFSLDAFDLAQKGTVAYNVEFPLWADNNEKGRWVHVPMKIDGSRLVRQSITYDAQAKRFDIPENTRFYKSFYKLVKGKDGKTVRARRIETRIILVRYPFERTLFGTYRWDETEQVATLVDTPYRDGTPFRDTVFPVLTDERKGTYRKYAIPGRHRCLECHMGSDTKSFILGFSPLQINRRKPGEYARNQKVSADEITLAERLAAYGVVSGYVRAEELPRLESAGTASFKNIYEFRAQQYMVGNCAHCHNPEGFAAKSGITLSLHAGAIFNFNTRMRSVNYPNRAIVHTSGDEGRSYIYNKLADPPQSQGIYSRMPMHTPGTPDCNALTAIGKWVRSFESIAAAEAFEPECKTAPDDFDFVEQDFTWPRNEGYVPRRDDWKDPQNGMPQKFRDLVYTPGLQELVTRSYAVGYWNEKDECKFPEIDLPAEKRRPWMIDDEGNPKYPFGQVYYATPGSWYFRTTCIKCHGPDADGNTDLARGILNWSGGAVRVANLRDELFGNQGQNLGIFDVTVDGNTVRNLGGNYLIWMAMEGTRVKFPPEASNFTGRHGAQMLNRVRDSCLRQISPDKASSPNYPEHEIYRDVCFFNNWSPGDERLRFDPESLEPVHPEQVELWLDRAAYNAGWAIFQYLKDASIGLTRPGNDQCEKVFPRN